MIWGLIATTAVFQTNYESESAADHFHRFGIQRKPSLCYLYLGYALTVGWEASELPYKALFQQPPSEARLQDFPARALSSELEV